MQLLELLFVKIVSLKSLGNIAVHLVVLVGVNAKYYK